MGNVRRRKKWKISRRSADRRDSKAGRAPQDSSRRAKSAGVAGGSPADRSSAGEEPSDWEMPMRRARCWTPLRRAWRTRADRAPRELTRRPSV